MAKIEKRIGIETINGWRRRRRRRAAAAAKMKIEITSNQRNENSGAWRAVT
jgi:hypothetical protein